MIDFSPAVSFSPKRWLGYCAGFFLVFTVATAVFALTTIWQSYRFWFQTPNDPSARVEVTVQPGESFKGIADDLASQEIVASAFWFRIYGAFSGHAGDIQAGDFTLTPGSNYATIVTAMTHAETNEVTLTIPEGYTIAQIGELVTAKFSVTAEEWQTLTGLHSPLNAHPFVVAAQKPADVDLEGYLFPDTYRFHPDSTGEEIVTKLIDTMQQRVASVGTIEHLGTGASDVYASIHDYLTLASMLEKEVRQPDTMANVADIFEKRLQTGMPLQADSTVNYITNGNDPSVSLLDTQIASQFNTYKYPGLPPGPISNPGLNALIAAAHPTKNTYYYFLTTPEGDVYYANTYDQHLANKRKYLH